MRNLIVFVILIGLGLEVAEAQDAYPIVPKQHFSCRYFGLKSRKPLMEKDLDAATTGSANQLARATELQYVDAPKKEDQKWVLWTDFYSQDTKDLSDTNSEGVGVSCSPSYVNSPIVIHQQDSGKPYILANKVKFVCTYKTETTAPRLILNKQISAINADNAVRVARVGELVWDDKSVGRPPRWVLMSDLNNPTPSYSFTRGVRVDCIPAATSSRFLPSG